MVVVTSPSVIRAMVGLASVLYRAASWTYDNCSRWNARRQRNTGDVVLVPPPLYTLYPLLCRLHGSVEGERPDGKARCRRAAVDGGLVALSHEDASPEVFGETSHGAGVVGEADRGRRLGALRDGSSCILRCWCWCWCWCCFWFWGWCSTL